MLDDKGLTPAMHEALTAINGTLGGLTPENRAAVLSMLPRVGPVAPVLVERLPIVLDNKNNWKSRRWQQAKDRKQFEEILRLGRHERTPFDFLVRIHITRILGKGQRFWDADSVLRGNSKELIDSLVALGWFHDDGKKYIDQVTASQDATQRNEGPAVLIEVWRADYDL